MELTPQQLSGLHNKLIALEQDLIKQIQLSESATGIVTLDQTSVGRVSRIDAMQQQKMAISTRQHAQVRLRKVIVALKAMDIDDYGFCRQCDEPIAFKRLEIQPEANLCLDCQSKADRS